ncbi:conserved hypothetical protein [Talaromyces stipitatus ATCC 10500]|uniref:DnaJ homologue subfamily C member 28 conserved domain-containing protein n=1 Tax=Talaromyces stipitatus (strain ATCC 10500 / CBS 375.48 / QM 6759 / NRRL 1006) TaxID=441959 RepID=B8MGL5_TALSN|nr:uncharacterized protein TSTA_018370 [Talaromyces stipitatus ATCC 10500]EED16766.1 conserved hypothetical protein [Talaromyces stipitatus ATCC 10500]
MIRVPRSNFCCTQCTSCLRAQRRLPSITKHRRTLSASSSRKDEKPSNGSEPSESKQEGALSRRLAEMTEESLLEGGRSAHKNLQEAGFSDDLKRALEEKIKAASFKSENAQAFSVLNTPTSAGKGTRDHAMAAPWRGTENVQDTALRMLDDAKKPIRVPFKIPNPAIPVNVNLKPGAKVRHSTGSRLASARDKTQTYALSQSSGLSDKEREEIRSQLTARFEAGARSLPMTLSGLSSLANERIEDAIARGQFKNLPRGKGKHTTTDHNANSAFIDTTEYFMNKIIQKQEIVPPWIEKQQDLSREIDRFRQRLRTEWRRHAARIISSQGGSLEEQRRRARGYAAAEARLLAKKKTEASLTSSGVDDAVVLPSYSQISHDGRLAGGPPRAVPVPSTESAQTETDAVVVLEDTASSEDDSLPHLPPLRDPEYMSIERGWHELQIKSINDLTRSYNLQAPRLAQKPYLNLERELNSCYADVAPSLADELTLRATTPRKAPNTVQKPSGGLLEDIIQSNQKVRVYDEDRSKGYGLKEFWRDLWRREKAT